MFMPFTVCEPWLFGCGFRKDFTAASMEEKAEEREKRADSRLMKWIIRLVLTIVGSAIVMSCMEIAAVASMYADNIADLLKIGFATFFENLLNIK